MARVNNPKFLVLSIGNRLFAQDPNRNDWDKQITNIAELFEMNMTEDEIRCELAGFWDKDRAERLELVDPNIWTKLEEWYTNRFCKKLRIGSGGYDFVMKTILRGPCHPIQQAINHHLDTVAKGALRNWRMKPHDNKFNSFAGLFNASANTLNSKVKVQIPLAKTPPKRDYKPTLAYKPGLLFCTFSGMTDSVMGCPEAPWVEAIKKLQDKDGHVDLEAVKSSNSELYNQMTTFHMTQKVVLHRKSKMKVCTIPKEHLGQLAEMFTAQLIAGRNIVNPDTDIKYFTNFRNCNLPWHHHDGDPYLRCPCFSPQDSQQCPACFNVKNAAVIADLHNIFDKVPEVQDQAKELFDEIHRVTTLPIKTNRTHPVCPNCHFENINEEAILNLTGANPAIRHPTDMVCESCEHKFCTDCGGTHPGIICRGWPGPPDVNGVVQACPGCKHPTERTEGCAYIQCGIPTCRKMWCWVCRCFRKLELHDAHPDPNKGHICLVIGKAENNPVWRGNPDVTIYQSSAPGNIEWVPL